MEWIITILALGLVIFIHEMGHLLAAKWSGIGASEFSVGMGPKLFGKRFGETEYNLRLLPIGGFVKIAGLDDQDGPVPPELDFYQKPFLARLATIFAGPFMNLILGFVIFSTIFAVYGGNKMTSKIDFIKPNSPAALAGLHPGDIIQAVDTTPVTDAKRDIIRLIRTSHNHPLTFKILRQSQVFTTVITPLGAIPQVGITFATQSQAYSLPGAIQEGFFETGRQIQMVGLTLKMLISGQAGLKDLAGPVGILQMASMGFSRGFSIFLGIMGMISIGLGVANLFPLPVLDGGHIMLLCIEKIRGKRLAPKVEEWITNIGMGLLLALMLVIIGNDLLHWKDRIMLLKGLK